MSNTTLPAEKLSASIAKNLLKVLSISDDPKICEEFQHIRDSLTDDEVTEQLIERLTPFIERGMMVPVTQMKSMMKKMPVTPSEEFSADSDDDFSPEESPYSYTQSFSCPSNDNSREATQPFQIALPGEFSQESDGEAAYFQVKQQETAYFPVPALAGEFSQESDGETVYFPVKQTKVEAEFTEDEAACGPVEEFSHESDDEPGFNYQCQPVPPVFSQPAYHHSNNDKEFSSQDEL